MITLDKTVLQSIAFLNNFIQYSKAKDNFTGKCKTCLFFQKIKIPSVCFRDGDDAVNANNKADYSNQST